MREPFRLSDSAPTPQPEVISAADCIARTPDSDISSDWKAEIRRLEELVHPCEPMQAEWDRMTPTPLRGASAGTKSVALILLMSQFGLGGSRWMKQFIYGFGAMGAFSHDVLFTHGGEMEQPASPARPFSDAASRFDKRANSS